MFETDENFNKAIVSPARQIVAKVEVYTDGASTLSKTFTPKDKLSNFTITRTPQMGKFFGMTIGQSIDVLLLDRDNDLGIKIGDYLVPYIGVVGSEYDVPFTGFKVTEILRDDVKKTTTVKGIDIIEESNNMSAKLFLDKMTYPKPAPAIGTLIGQALSQPFNREAPRGTYFYIYKEENPLNFSGNETMREVLTAYAESLNSIVFSDNRGIVFKTPQKSSIYTINKANYFDFTVGSPINLTQVTYATSLGDNVSVGTPGGFNQVLMNNAFLSPMMNDTKYIQKFLDNYKDLEMRPYTLKWRGNPAIELGDLISVQTNEGTVTFPYYGDKITYNGGLKMESSWKCEEQEQIHTNPSNLGEALKDTFAKVDKVKQEVELVAKHAEENSNNISSIVLNTDSITQSVESLSQQQNEIRGSVDDVRKSVENKIDADQVAIEVKKQIGEGADAITTKTGFTFNDEGLTVSKQDKEIETKITEDGMAVLKNNEQVLTANNQGVDAINITVNTYLIVGDNSRFEDYGYDRTGCFFVGGAMNG